MASVQLIKKHHVFENSLQETTQEIIFQYDWKKIQITLSRFGTPMLLKLYEELKKELGIIKIENIALENFVERNDPGIKARLDNLKEKIYQRPRIHFAESLLNEKSLTIGFRASMASTRRSDQWSLLYRSSTKTPFNELNYSIKIDIVENLVRELTEKTDKFEKEVEKELVKYAACVKEAKFELSDTEHTIDGLDEIVVKDINNSTISSERFLKYVRNWIVNSMALLNTMTIKIDSINKNCYRQKQILMRKKDLIGICKPVDFEQLRISKDTLTTINNDKKNHVMTLKNNTTYIAASLNIQKRNLMALEDTLRKLNNEIMFTKDDIEKIFKEEQETKKQIEKIKVNFLKLKEQIEVLNAPKISDYFKIKNYLQGLQKEEKLLKRRNRILELKLKTSKRNLFKKKNK